MVVKSEIDILNLLIGDIAESISPILWDCSVTDAFFKFMKDEKLNLISVVNEKGEVVGQLVRMRFLEKTVLGRFGYGIHLNARKKIYEVMEKPSLIIDYYLTIEEASMLVQTRKMENIYDDIIVTKNNVYYGTLPINILLNFLTQKTIMLARESNPLTGLPGNWAIKREIEKRILYGKLFDIAYIDINNFKPYNDYYGFEKGDKVIITLGEILHNISKKNPLIFVGHVGGDDFIILTDVDEAKTICEELIEAFEKNLFCFHGDDFHKGYYISKNRKEETEKFPLLSITCAIVSNRNGKISSFAHLASIASEVKAEAKRRSRLHKRSIIFEDRRND